MAFGLSSNHFFVGVGYLLSKWLGHGLWFSRIRLEQESRKAPYYEKPFPKNRQSRLAKFSVAAFLGPCLDENEQLSCFLNFVS